MSFSTNIITSKPKLLCYFCYFPKESTMFILSWQFTCLIVAPTEHMVALQYVYSYFIFDVWRSLYATQHKTKNIPIWVFVVVICSLYILNNLSDLFATYRFVFLFLLWQDLYYFLHYKIQVAFDFSGIAILPKKKVKTTIS